MALQIKLQAFEGPLDLLLHLIDINKVDIYDIPIVEITEQYLEYIKSMEYNDMEVTSEFLVMAATLLDIKCRMLLPKPVNEEGVEEDPRAELVEQLLAYKMYKYMSLELKDMQTGSDMHFFRKKRLPDEVSSYEVKPDLAEMVGDRTLNSLGSILEELLKRQKALYIRAYIREHKRVAFRQLLEKQRSKYEIIVTFLLILEEMKLGAIEVEQESEFGEIYINFKKTVEMYQAES